MTTPDTIRVTLAIAKLEGIAPFTVTFTEFDEQEYPEVVTPFICKKMQDILLLLDVSR